MTVSAATIDAYLRTGRTPRAIADWFGIPLTQVLSRYEIMSRRAAERAQRLLDRANALAAKQRDVEPRGGIEKWLALDIRYEDDTRSKPFDYARAWANTVAIARSRPQVSSFGGGVSDIYESERGFDFHASRKEAA